MDGETFSYDKSVTNFYFTASPMMDFIILQADSVIAGQIHVTVSTECQLEIGLIIFHKNVFIGKYI